MVLFTPGNPILQVLLVFAMGGMAAGAVTTNSQSLPALYAFLVPGLGPLVVRLFVEGDMINSSMGLMLLLFVAMLAWIGRNMNNRIMQNVRLRLELVQARDVAEGANRAKADFLSVVPTNCGRR